MTSKNICYINLDYNLVNKKFINKLIQNTNN